MEEETAVQDDVEAAIEGNGSDGCGNGLNVMYCDAGGSKVLAKWRLMVCVDWQRITT